MTVVTQLTPNIGAEITEIDLRHPIDTNTANWLKGQLVKHKVIFFRDQAIDSQEHLNFAQLFGDLETHPVNPKEGFSEILVLHNHADNPPSDTAVWHSDVTWRDKPSIGSILVARKVPNLGGDTLFANMELAYDGLDDQTKNLIKDDLADLFSINYEKKPISYLYCGRYKNFSWGWSQVNLRSYEKEIMPRHMLEWKVMLYYKNIKQSFYEIGIRYVKQKNFIPTKKELTIKEF